MQPTSIPSRQYQPEVIPPPTYTPKQTSTISPTGTPAVIFTPTATPLSLSINGPLPDLIVSGISDPVCAPELSGTTIRFIVYVKNIGRAPTRSFGLFDVGVSLIIGQQKYGLEERRTKFNGVVGNTDLQVFNLKPNADARFTVVIDLKGNKDFGVEVTANSSENPIREADMTNNTLIKYFSTYCY
ncbi:MAG: hypothetical protein FIB03_16470 [Anaerolineae bacterium]|nr:hypothetical protein [Anaerolineae bacterium]